MPYPSETYERAVRGQGEVGRVVERRAGAEDRAEVHAGGAGVGRGPARAEGQQEDPVGRELLDGVVEVVGAIDGVVGADRDPVGAGEQAFAPRVEKPAVAVEDDDRVLAPVEDEDAVAGIDRDAGDLDEPPAVGQRAPALADLQGKGSSGHDEAH